MNQKLYQFTFALLLAASTTIGQTAGIDLNYYIGSGSDTTVLIVDFQDGSPDSSYAWGYLHDGTATGEDMLNDVAAADVNFSIKIDTASFGNFLQDIYYNQHQGLGGSPDFWGTWEGNTLAGLSANGGIADTLVSGGIFGCSYMDFSPSIAPGAPWAAYDSAAFTPKDVAQWYGNGSDSTVVIIDFLNGTDTSSFAWGFAFNDSIENFALLDSLAQNIALLSVNFSAGLNSITYDTLSGQVGATADWYNWTATNYGNWKINYGNSVYLKDGEMLAFTFNRFLELQRPMQPINTGGDMNLPQARLQSQLDLYPNPAQNTVQIDGPLRQLQVYSANGRLMHRGKSPRLNVSDYPRGVYFVILEDEQGGRQTQRLVVR